MAGLSGPSRIGLVSLITLIRVLVPTSPPSPPRLECPALTQRGPLVRFPSHPSTAQDWLQTTNVWRRKTNVRRAAGLRGVKNWLTRRCG